MLNRVVFSSTSSSSARIALRPILASQSSLPSRFIGPASRFSTLLTASRPSPSPLRSTTAAVTAPPFPSLSYSTMSPRAAPLRLGSTAPNFDAETTQGPLNLHDFIDRTGSWVVLFSHPEDYTPVCTTELGAFAKLTPEFEKRGVKLLGLSANTVESHKGWIKDINDVNDSDLQFPIIGDKSRKIAELYDMIDHQDATNVDAHGAALTIRSVFIIDPKRVIRTILSYPASTGRNSAEVLRIIDSLQTGDAHKVTTPIDWQNGDDVIVHPATSTEDAKKKFSSVRVVKPYLRFTPDPRTKSSKVE